MNNVFIPAKDSDGFLLDPSDWNIQHAETVAKEFRTELSKNHWIVIKYIRKYFDEHQKVPELRYLLKYFKNEYGADKSTRKYIYKLFPYGYGQQACKIAGMRQPKKLWLDL
ncbi:MAG: TusE/DsrC/DsvC family sulfur relay protein [Gammaproteobacteria bacterium]|jgi:TusE/DsrC/DsvC family sulfur relay protein|nr:TusE/DsrC/DsvC family sulfur relay protein [Gammaproteobacteria bacterium]MBT4462396.1 TusE/DsrC/DsvC family sulfur relay protein [Gammaproteobacteria bacterium]MBT4655323.1 TusE/DsrC/DsvC family sulfur relay protein [Gammaproteobacteria bacterium]MBT5117249.1 TusE/DsrC/DsvC family sulfur relay protein [Gammaproteobacteria bacterium]MBT5762138.1 TusE/DsrC/DsvC family sulfur relay protein [Gammaproteobacteria bacterium]